MASAATAKRRTALSSSSNGKAAKAPAASTKDAPAEASSGLTKPKGMQEQPAGTDVAAQQTNLTKSEKRRIAALISWEKRRKAYGKTGTTKKGAAASETATAATPVTPPKGKKRSAPKNKADAAGATAAPPAKKRKIDAGQTVSKASTSKGSKDISEIRRQAAKLGWERRKSQQLAAESSGTSDASSADERPPPAAAKRAVAVKKTSAAAAAASKKVYTVSERRQAAILGWERRNNKQKEKDAKKDAAAIRREAAKLGWERRRSQLAAESSGTSDASSADEGRAAASDVSATVSKKKKATSARKAYSASARRQAAKLGWEKRRLEKAARRNSTSSSITSEDIMAIVTAKPPPPKKETNPSYRQGTKRSRRLAAADDSTSAPNAFMEETRHVSELVTYLRISRGWMEFHPSSRHGSGTATYGYIPSSIASFIRSGTISQRTVLEHGTLGVHYALDWEGYGGLKDMIATFGEDYSPYPTEDMMASSRITEWELGEDLPWREVEEAEDKKMRLERENVKAKVQGSGSATKNDIEDEDMEDIMFVANILANLDRSASKECEQDKNNELAKTKSLEAPSPSILALQNYDSESESEEEGKIQGKSLLSHLADVSVMKEKECTDQCQSPDKIVNAEVLIIQNPFNHWNFGLA